MVVLLSVNFIFSQCVYFSFLLCNCPQVNNQCVCVCVLGLIALPD